MNDIHSDRMRGAPLQSVLKSQCMIKNLKKNLSNCNFISILHMQFFCNYSIGLPRSLLKKNQNLSNGLLTCSPDLQATPHLLMRTLEFVSVAFLGHRLSRSILIVVSRSEQVLQNR